MPNYDPDIRRRIAHALTVVPRRKLDTRRACINYGRQLYLVARQGFLKSAVFYFDLAIACRDQAFKERH